MFGLHWYVVTVNATYDSSLEQGTIECLTHNIRLGYLCLPDTNALAYYSEVNNFKMLNPGRLILN
jgi:hypothetical protein